MVLAFYDRAHKGARTKIGYYGKKMGFSVSYAVPDWYDALSEAIALHKDGVGVVHLIGHLQDISIPSVKTTIQHNTLAALTSAQQRELREAFMVAAATNNVKLHALDLEEFRDKASKADKERSATIASYCQSLDVLHTLQTLHQRRRWAREGSNEVVLSGRPPFGYSVEDGKLVVNEHQAKAVRFIFRERAKGVESMHLIAALKEKYPYADADQKKLQCWDRCKLHRIAKYADLYKNGHYVNESLNAEITLTDLIILPAEKKASA